MILVVTYHSVTPRQHKILTLCIPSLIQQSRADIPRMRGHAPGGCGAIRLQEYPQRWAQHLRAQRATAKRACVPCCSRHTCRL